MYTGVNDIMRQDHGPESSLGDTLLAVSLKALTTDQPSAELVTPTAGCEPLCANQAARTALLTIMPTLDDVDIAPVQRGDQSRGVVIPGPSGPGGAAGGHGHGGVPVGGGPAGSRSGAPTGGRGGTADGSSAAGSSSAAAPGKGKQTRVVLDDDEVSSDEDEPLQKRQRQLSGARPAVLDEAVAADKEAAAKRAAKEAAAKKAAEERVAEEAPAKAAAAEAAGATGAKRVAAPCGSTPPAKRPCRGVRKPRFVHLSLPLFSFFCGFILLLPFLPRSSPSSAAAATGTAAADAVVGAASGPAPVSEPRTPEGVPEDVVESEGEPEVAPEAVPEVVQEEAPTEGAMIVVRAAAAPPPSRGARAPLSSAPHRVVALRVAAGEGMEVVLGHPPLTRRVTSP
jgi:hypothetical protein